MKNLETLIQELCPDGVEFVKIGDFCIRNKGISITAAKMKEINKAGAPVRIFAAGNTKADVEYEDIDSKSVVFSPSVIVKSRGNIGFEYYDKPFSHKTEMWSYTSKDCDKLDIKFLFYYLSSLTEKFQAKARANAVKLPQLAIGDTDKFEIPLPPIEVQTEIVRILDKFTSLEAELEAELKVELDCRKRQYEYYRDKLLSFDNVGGQEVEWKKMSEVGTFIRGNGLQKKDFTEEGVGCIHYGQLYTHYGTSATETITYCPSELAKKLRKAAKGDIVIATTSENVEDVCKAVAWLGEEEIAVSGDAFIYKHSQNPKYMAYLFQTASFFNYKKKKATGTKVIRLTGDAMGNYLAPIPSLEEQHRIVSILDRFESLTTSLQSGLPAEITARRQQYEYYRDKLLTFKRKGAA